MELLICFLISAFAWIAVMVTERRTVLSGFLLLLTQLLLGMFLLSCAIGDPDWFSEHFIFHILLDIELIFIAILLVAYPLVMVPVFLIGGVVLMKREGFRPRNILSVGLAGLLIAFDVGYPMLFNVTDDSISTRIYWYITMISMYFVIQLASFWISDILNLIHIKKNKGLRYVVVLGAGLSGTKPTPLLRARIDKGIETYRNNPGSKLIMSGGQGKDELLPEGRAMADYALSEGVSEEDIIIEDRSKNTEENIRFSSGLMEGGAPFAVVTSSYHLMRALMIARRQKLRCIGYGAHTRLYFTLNAFLREYAGYFRDTRYVRLIHLICLTVLYVIFTIGTISG